jgi:predicted ester cyclase
MARLRKRVREEDITMSAEENKGLLRREVEELYNHTGNLDAVEEIFAPNYVSHEPTSGETRGIEGARQFAATFRQAFPDLQCTIEDMVAEGDKVVMRFRSSGTHQGETEAFGPPTGKRMGKIVEAWTNFDAMGMMHQLGMVPEAQQAER